LGGADYIADFRPALELQSEKWIEANAENRASIRGDVGRLAGAHQRFRVLAVSPKNHLIRAVDLHARSISLGVPHQDVGVVLIARATSAGPVRLTLGEEYCSDALWHLCPHLSAPPKQKSSEMF
jgi:hypothetical protein